jgi:hypothetical protein
MFKETMNHLSDEIKMLGEQVQFEKSLRIDANENLQMLNEKVGAIQKELQLNNMKITLRENAMLGRLDNYKDEIFEMRKLIETQFSSFRKMEDKIKESSNHTGNIFGICDSHVMQLESTMKGMFGMLENLKKSFTKIEYKLAFLEKKLILDQW